MVRPRHKQHHYRNRKTDNSPVYLLRPLFRAYADARYPDLEKVVQNEIKNRIQQLQDYINDIVKQIKARQQGNENKGNN